MARPTLPNSPHRRWNPLTRRWVLVSPQRTQRPWQGDVARPDNPSSVSYDPNCYLCPGNTRSRGEGNPHYSGTFVFDNDFPALIEHSQPAPAIPSNDLFKFETESGICRVLCFHPRHDLTLARMDFADIERVVNIWCVQYAELAQSTDISYVQIFENRGAMMGASNPHPHCQIWATNHVPEEPARELAAQFDYRSAHGTCLLCDYTARESSQAERLVCENEEFIVVVPFWAVWPFETLILSRQHLGSLTELNAAQRAAYADILKRLTTRYDNLFETAFPYTMGLHSSPADGNPHPEWHFHTHFYPPLLRGATVRKFMVGFEMLGMPQRDITPEDAAARLRNLSEIHYSEKSAKEKS